MAFKSKYLVLFFLIFIGCTDRLIVYEYGGAVVTRRDVDATTYLYYGDFRKGNYPDSYVKITYSGFNSGLVGYLIFNDEGNVEVRDGGGYFDLSGEKKGEFFMSDIENIAYVKWHDSISGRYNNVVFLSDIISKEKEVNMDNKSKVKANYIKVD